MNNEAIFLAKKLLVDSIWKSARLEGFNTTFPKTEEILDNIQVDTSRDEVLFIVNMKRAWEFTLDNIDCPSNLAFLEELNKLVGNNLFYGAGEIRTLPVRIGGTDWEPKISIRSVIFEEVQSILKISDVEERALKMFCYVARTQMFLDGNKRVAQLIANKILIENNIGIFQIPVQAIERFKVLLINFYESNNDSAIVQFMKRYCIKHIIGGDEVYKEDIPVTFETVEIKQPFMLSHGQISTMNKVLKNLRKLLVANNYKGKGVLTEKDNVVYLSVNQNVLSSLSLEEASLLDNKTDIKDSTLYQFISGTLLLLNKYIPFSVKSIYFDVQEYELTMGILKDSETEKGSIDFILE